MCLSHSLSILNGIFCCHTNKNKSRKHHRNLWKYIGAAHAGFTVWFLWQPPMLNLSQLNNECRAPPNFLKFSFGIKDFLKLNYSSMLKASSSSSLINIYIYNLGKEHQIHRFAWTLDFRSLKLLKLLYRSERRGICRERTNQVRTILFFSDIQTSRIGDTWDKGAPYPIYFTVVNSAQI